MPLRIAHVANEPFGVNTANGVQHVVYCLARAQAQKGEAVAVFTRDDHAVHVLGSATECSAPGTNGHQVAAGRFRLWLLSRYSEPALLADILKWQPDIVHFHSVHIPQNIALAIHLASSGIPYCVTVHAGLFPSALQRGRLKKAIFARLFERRYLNQAQFIHALTPDESEAIRRHGVHTRIVIVPNGLPPDSDVVPTEPANLSEEHPWLRDRRVFMFIGRLDPWQKGLDLLLEGFAQAALRNAALVLVGPEYRTSLATLHALAGRLCVSSDVLFMKPAFGKDRANLLAAADVFVHTSRWEGVSLSVLAAAAAGKPSVITRQADPFGALQSVNGAIVVEPSAASIARGLKRAASFSIEELRAMGSRARQAAGAKFTWSLTAETLIDAYRLALAGRAGRDRDRVSLQGTIVRS